MACQSPIMRPSRDGFRDVPVPCGRCPPCLKNRVDSWVFRLKQQEKVSTHSHFITLTYDTQFVPISPNGFMTLCRDAFPLFMKRLRKLCPDFKLSYYACGEYGTKKKRPHYHAIVFNVPDDSFFFKAWSLNGVPFGSVHVGQVSGDSIAYCTKYMNKTEHIKGFLRDDRVPEFSLMSKGMGKNYVNEKTIAYHNADLNRNFLAIDGGFKIALPRYYRDRIFSKDAMEDMQDLATGRSLDLDLHNRRYFERKYRSRPDYTYEQFCNDQRLARVNSFNSQQSDRDV